MWCALRLESVGGINQSEVTHLEKILVILACLQGVMLCDGTNQVQVVLDLSVPMPDAVLDQGMLFSGFSSHGSADHVTASVEPRHCLKP